MEDRLSNPEGGKRISFGRLLWVGPLAVLAAVIANVLVSITAVALVGISPEFEPLHLRSIIRFTVAGVLRAVIVFALGLGPVFSPPLFWLGRRESRGWPSTSRSALLPQARRAGRDHSSSLTSRFSMPVSAAWAPLPLRVCKALFI